MTREAFGDIHGVMAAKNREGRKELNAIPDLEPRMDANPEECRPRTNSFLQASRGTSESPAEFAAMRVYSRLKNHFSFE
jgi:hypothetical protein